MSTVTKLLSASFLIFLLSFSIVSTSAGAAFSDDSKIPEFVEGQLIVSFSPSLNPNQVDDFIDSMSKSHGINKIRDLDRKIQNSNDLQEILVKVPSGHERSLIKILEKNPNVKYAELNYVVRTMDTFPNDSSFNSLWGLHNTGQTGGTADADIDAPLAWDIFQGTDTIVVGVVDTGIDYTHPDLAANIWTNPGEIAGNGIDDDANGYIDDIHGWDVINGDSDPMDDHDHGTHVAGTIGGVGNNGNGVVGVNWDVTMVACKFLSASGSGTTAGAIECFNYFESLGIVDITNNSWGGGEYNQALIDVMASTPNTLHVIAAGNDDNDNDASPSYPANYPISNKLVVAASDHNDSIASFSSYGSHTVDLAAPGVSILSSVPGGGYSSFSGTSMATPHVAGAAALIWGNDPSLNQDKIQEIIRCNTDPISDSKLTKTNGRLNIGNALETGDSTAPSLISDLTVAQTGLSTAQITLTSTGDDGGSGTASCYDLRYSISPIVNEEDWGNANVVFGEPKPKSSGNTEFMTVKGLEPETTYYFATKVGDNSGNFSPISNYANGTTTSGTVAFEDDMEVFNADNWNWDPLWHTTQIRANSDQWSWYYGQEDSNDYDTNAANEGTLETKKIDLTDATDAILYYSEWIQVENDPSYDRTRVGISTDGVWFTTIFESHGNEAGGPWTDRKVDLNDYAGQEIYIGFNFDTIDGLINNYEGWYIDDVRVLKDSTTDPPETNNPPTSDVGGPYTGTEGISIGFDGSGSSDSDGTITGYDWDFGDGNTGTGVAPSHTYAASGIYTVKLTVTDDDGDSHMSSTTATIDAVANNPPTSNVGGPYIGTEGTSLDFDGSGSTDSDGTITNYDWDFGDDNTGTGVAPSHTYAASGIYTVKLTVTDDDGDSHMSSTTATIDAEGKTITITNPPPGEISGKVEISTVLDGFDSVNFVIIEIFKLIDGIPEAEPIFTDTVLESPYSTSVHTKSLDDGVEYQIIATANDDIGDIESDPVLVNIPAKGGGNGGNDKSCNPNKPGCIS